MTGSSGPRSAPGLRWALAAVWVSTGLLVFHPHFREVGQAYLDPLGLTAAAMVACCLFEVGLGLRVGLGRASAGVTALQVALVAGFTAVLARQDPWLLVHPYGALTKNVPLLAAAVGAFLLEREGWTARAAWTLRLGVSFIWLSEGLLPKVLFQQPLELEVVRASGLAPMDPATCLLLLGLAEAASGVGVLLLRGPLCALLLWAQAAALVALPLLVSWQDPLLWAHPFGPLTKNLPILAATLALAGRSLREPFLTARWRHLCLVSYAVPPERLWQHVPEGVELDLYQGQAWVSLVALDFEATRVSGLRCPGATRFPDVNLRFYVRRGDQRGVVFVRELVPSRLVALMAWVIYGEPFSTAGIDSRVEQQDGVLRVERRVTLAGRTHRLALRALPATHPPSEGSAAGFLLERRWGFRCGRAGRLHAFRVERPAWLIHPTEGLELEWDFAAVYGPDWAFLQEEVPASLVMAAGSHVAVSLPSRGWLRRDRLQ